MSLVNQKNQMSKIHFKNNNNKEGIKSCNWFQIFVQQNHAPFYESTCSLDELDEKRNHSKISKFWNFERKGYKGKDSFKKPFDKKIMFNGFKMSSFRCRSHVNEINMPKNMFGCLLKFILGFSRIFYISSIKLKYSYTIMYDCEKLPLTRDLSYIRLFNFIT